MRYNQDLTVGSNPVVGCWKDFASPPLFACQTQSASLTCVTAIHPFRFGKFGRNHPYVGLAMPVWFQVHRMPHAVERLTLVLGKRHYEGA